MTNLKPVETVRLRNFCELQSRTEGYGAPTAKHLAKVLSERGARVTPPQLTSIYQGETPISFEFASKIESALSLPQGWLSEDHEFVFRLTPSEIEIHTALAALPPKIKQAIASIVQHLAKAS